MDPGTLIAIDVVLLYTIFGPLVLFGTYVFFDSLEGSGKQGKNRSREPLDKKEPALWTSEEVDASKISGYADLT